MKKLHWIIIAVLTAVFVAVGCSKDEEPKKDLIPEYNGAYLIKDGMIYIYYAPYGMKYSPIPAESLPYNLYIKIKDNVGLNHVAVFEGEFEGQHAYWFHYIGCFENEPGQLDTDANFIDHGDSFNKLYRELTCIYIGERYFSSYFDYVTGEIVDL